MNAKSRPSLALALVFAAAMAFFGCSSSSPVATQADNNQSPKPSGALGGIFESEKPVRVPEGTAIHVASEFAEIAALLDGGVNLAEAVIPRTAPRMARQLTLFGE